MCVIIIIIFSLIFFYGASTFFWVMVSPLGFETSDFVKDENVSPMPNLHPEDAGSPYLSSTSVKTSQAKVATPEAKLLSA